MKLSKKIFLLFAFFFSSLMAFSSDEQGAPEAAEEAAAENRKVHDPEKLTVFLDMDEVLIHTVFISHPEVKSTAHESIERFTLSIHEGDHLTHFIVLLRPGVKEFIRECAQRFNTYVFTSSTQNYADPILDVLDTDALLLGRFYRKNCRVYMSIHPGSTSGVVNLKDLTKLPFKVNLERSILVDNSTFNFFPQPANGLHLPDWKGEREATSGLESVLRTLKVAQRKPDVREILKAFDKHSDSEVFEALKGYLIPLDQLESDGDEQGAEANEGKWV